MLFKTKPFKHQRDVWESSRDLEWFAIFWEQGTGKTKLALDTVASLYLEGKINGLLIVAPNTIHANWVVKEMPTHLSDEVPFHAHIYHASKQGLKRHQRSLESLMVPAGNRLAVLAITYDSLITPHGRNAARAFLKRYRCLEVLDESARIKNHKAKRSKLAVASGAMAQYRRVLTGTPVANSPFDVYNQFKFLSPTFWKDTLGISGFLGFKTTFGVFKKGYNAAAGREFDLLVDYKNLDLLYETIRPFCSRVTKDDVLDLPPKLYTSKVFELTPAQKRIYEEIRTEFMSFLGSGEMVSADLVIVRLLRLQQVVCGYVGNDAGEVEELPGKNPRFDLLKELCEDLSHPTIIWGKFTKDIDMICEHLGNRAVRYDGSTGPDERLEAIARFQGERAVMDDQGRLVEKQTVPDAERAQFFVANPAAAGEGLTLTAARTVIYYNNSFKLTDRLQSEDRAHRIGQEHLVNYIDLVASGTVDQYILKALLLKRDVASQITGDELKNWLEPGLQITSV